MAITTLILAAAPAFSHAQGDLFTGRPGLTSPERPPVEIATCENLKRTVTGLKQPAERIDLWATGSLTLVHTDGVLWYLAICSQPGVRVLCITYNDNGMKIGDRVTIKGGFNLQDKDHVALDPCLASRT